MGCTSSSAATEEDIVAKENYEQLRCIGQGGFGEIYCVQPLSGPNKDTFYAMKTMKKREILDRKFLGEVKRELMLMVHIKHPFLTNVLCAFQDSTTLYVVMDLCIGGDLRYALSHMPKRNGKRPGLSEDRCRFYTFMVASALLYLHERLRVIHRDVKPNNIILDGRGYVKLCDFGIAKNMDKNGYCKASSGTPGYMAPEVTNMERKCWHNSKADWFSLGVTLHELITRKRPKLENFEIDRTSGSTPRVTNDVDPDALTNIGEDGAALVAALLEPNSLERLGGLQVINHAWFKDLDEQAIFAGTATPPFVPCTTKVNFEIPKAEVAHAFGESDGPKEKDKLSKEENAKFVDWEYRSSTKTRVNKLSLKSFVSSVKQITNATVATIRAHNAYLTASRHLHDDGKDACKVFPDETNSMRANTRRIKATTRPRETKSESFYRGTRSLSTKSERRS